MILSLKERFHQSIVAMILFIKVMIALHTTIIYITCKKTNWCTFSRSYPTLRTFFAFSPNFAPLYLITRQRVSYLRLDDIPQQVADSIQGLRLDLSLKARYNKLTENPEFVEKIATASCLSALKVCDII